MTDKLRKDLNLQEVSRVLLNADRIMTEKLESDTVLLVTLADEMAERATMFEGQGYKSFLDARENFVTTLHKLNSEYKEFMSVVKSKA